MICVLFLVVWFGWLDVYMISLGVGFFNIIFIFFPFVFVVVVIAFDYVLTV